MNRRTDAWQNGYFRKMDDHRVHTTPNPHPPKMDFLSKTFLQIILAAKWLVQHSSMSHKQQRRSLPTLLSVSSSIMDCTYTQATSLQRQPPSNSLHALGAHTHTPYTHTTHTHTNTHHTHTNTIQSLVLSSNLLIRNHCKRDITGATVPHPCLARYKFS